MPSPTTLTRSLAAFLSSPDAFRILTTIPPSTPPPTAPLQTLIILDSSFNPPTRAHAQMATSALAAAGPSSRLLLLLSVHNADKAVDAATLAPRLRMMDGLARHLAGTGGIDLAVTRMAFFHAKADVIAASGVYDGDVEQVYLCGFDTVIRIFDDKYYYADEPGAVGVVLEPGEGKRRALGPFFARARLRVTVRPDDEWGSEREQRVYVDGLARGRDGAWARRVELVEGVGGVVSSSRVRRVVREGGCLDGLVCEEVGRVIEEEGLYRS